MNEEVEQMNKLAVEQLDAIQNNPMIIIKKALSHLPVLLLIGAGVFINWILAIVFLVSSFSTTTFFWIAVSLLFLVIIFPVAYLFAGRVYGQAVLIYEAYQAIIKPVLANLLTKVINKVLRNRGTTATSAQVEEEFKKESSSILDKIPDFIKNRLTLFVVIEDVIKIATNQYKDGSGKEVTRDRIIEFLDAKMGELASPSLGLFFKILLGNIIIVGFLFS